MSWGNGSHRTNAVGACHFRALFDHDLRRDSHSQQNSILPTSSFARPHLAIIVLRSRLCDNMSFRSGFLLDSSQSLSGEYAYSVQLSFYCEVIIQSNYNTCLARRISHCVARLSPIFTLIICYTYDNVCVIACVCVCLLEMIYSLSYASVSHSFICGLRTGAHCIRVYLHAQGDSALVHGMISIGSAFEAGHDGVISFYSLRSKILVFFLKMLFWFFST